MLGGIHWCVTNNASYCLKGDGSAHLWPLQVEVLISPLHWFANAVQAVHGHARSFRQRAFEWVVVEVVGVLAIDRRASATSKKSLQEVKWRRRNDRQKVVMAGFEPARSPNSALSCRLNHSATSPYAQSEFWHTYICAD